MRNGRSRADAIFTRRGDEVTYGSYRNRPNPRSHRSGSIAGTSECILRPSTGCSRRTSCPPSESGSDWRFTVEAIDKWRAEAEQGALGHAEEQMSHEIASARAARRRSSRRIAKIPRGAETDAAHVIAVIRLLAPREFPLRPLLALEVSARIVDQHRIDLLLATRRPSAAPARHSGRRAKASSSRPSAPVAA